MSSDQQKTQQFSSKPALPVCVFGYSFILAYIMILLLIYFCRMKLKDCLTVGWTKFTSLTYFESYPVLKQSIMLLDLLPLPPHNSLSDVFQSCRNLTTAYFRLLHMISKQPEYDGLSDIKFQNQLIPSCYFCVLFVRDFFLVMSFV